MAHRTRPVMRYGSLRDVSPETLLEARLDDPGPDWIPLGDALPATSPPAPSQVLLGPSLRDAPGARRLMRHAAAQPGVEVAAWGAWRAGAAALCGCESELAAARAAGCRLVWAGPGAAPGGAHVEGPLDALLPEEMGLAPYEAGDEGVAAWHRK